MEIIQSTKGIFINIFSLFRVFRGPNSNKPERDFEIVSLRFTNILRQPYPLYLEFFKTFPVIAAISLFVPLFLFTFLPFGLTAGDLASRKLFLAGFGMITFLLLSFNVYGLPRIFPQIFYEDGWTVGKEMLWVLWNVLTCVSASAIYEFIQPDCPFTFPQLARGYLQGFLMSIIPVAIVVLIAYLSLLKTRLRRAEAINRNLSPASSERQHKMLELTSDSGTEHVKILPGELLFIQSSDNYATVFWHDGSQRHSTLLRSSLKRLEAQIPLSYIVRCHRSFIVNLAGVQSVSGNANGYKLYLKRHPEPVPVARRFGKQVLSVLENIDRLG